MVTIPTDGIASFLPSFLERGRHWLQPFMFFAQMLKVFPLALELIPLHVAGLVHLLRRHAPASCGQPHGHSRHAP